MVKLNIYFLTSSVDVKKEGGELVKIHEPPELGRAGPNSYWCNVPVHTANIPGKFRCNRISGKEIIFGRTCADPLT